MDNFIPASRVGIYIMKYDYKTKMLNNPKFDSLIQIF